MPAAINDGQDAISIMDLVFDDLRRATAGASDREVEGIIRQARRTIDGWANGKLSYAKASSRMAVLDKRVVSLRASAKKEAGGDR
jgi:hypothetical protein